MEMKSSQRKGWLNECMCLWAFVMCVVYFGGVCCVCWLCHVSGPLSNIFQPPTQEEQSTLREMEIAQAKAEDTNTEKQGHEPGIQISRQTHHRHIHRTDGE